MNFFSKERGGAEAAEELEAKSQCFGAPAAPV